ncbi:phenylphosphate carboxylase subunit delta [Luteimonas sp. SJ-92]|uniref:3-deoxy-D-manno-octulosonate 8-phosphate phosphatase KdsC n=1 Tax=Luteimonas salinisoli TaxID=2752307 RepID=A0A853JFX5_9GAMM|nr:phenylphosphate carboxylase subunit delta [Luteimonas salinisoli]NZA27477.1 phenylphosphate carboxylase subunit delta [Luteimonas salinisoli]
MTALAAYPDDVLARAAKIRLACFDVDGTLTDGRLLFDAEGGEMKAFHVHDGQGLVLLRRAGIEVALVTARASAAVERRAAELGVQAHCAVGDKLARFDQIRAAHGLERDAVAFMGDDLPDLAPMRVAGLAVAPANAHAWAAAHAHWRTAARGGEGAARELCDLLLAAQGRLDALLAAEATP